MKRAFVSVLRLTALVGVFVLLPYINRVLNAQGTSSCQTWTAPTSDPCPSCCTLPGGNIPVVPFPTGPGKQSLQATSYSCGTQPQSCHYECSGTTYIAVDDGSCCIPDGGACSTGPNAKPCCDSGDTCTNGVCTASCGHIETCGDGEAWNSADCACEPATPILIDLSGNGFDLTSAAGGVQFDSFGTGHPIQTAWTAQGVGNAFLCYPDSNGKCDNGRDLFGNFTPQPSSSSPNGFAALAVYDGNGDGIIDSRDAVFSSLRLWIDANHDGISQPEELHTLPSLGVNSVSLEYKASEKRDRYGNVFRYRAHVNPKKGTDVGKTAYDVFFVTH